MLGLSLYDLFLGSLTIVAGIGLLMAIVIFFPRVVPGPDPPGRRSRRRAGAGEWRTGWSGCAKGIDEAHASVVAFNSPRGWLAAVLGDRCSPGRRTPTSCSPGYVALRALGIHANFVDILLVQTLVMFLLYFAPTPGAAGHRRGAVGGGDVGRTCRGS